MLADYVTLEQGTGAVHTAPGHGADDYHTGVTYGLEIYAPVDDGGHFNDDVELFAGLQVFEANPNGSKRRWPQRGRLWHREDFDAPLPALLALQQPGDLPRDAAVVHRDGRTRTCASARSQAIADTSLDPAAGARRASTA